MRAFLTAYKCLDDIFRQKSFSNIRLNEILRDTDAKDKPLVTKLVYGVLDNSIKIEYELNTLAKKIKPSVMTLLKIGAYALNELSLEHRYVFNECVETAKMLGKGGVSGFVNAVLREYAKNIGSFQMPKKTDENLSVKYSFPLWVVQKLIRSYGKEWTEGFLSCKQKPLTHIRINTDKISVEDFCSKLKQEDIYFEKSLLPDGLFIMTLPEKYKSYYTAQSAGSMLAVMAVQAKDGDKILDACAAPGGKSVYMAALAKKADITACDIHPHRVDLIKSYAAKMGASNVSAQVMDATQFYEQYENAFDKVLCDVPCSGFGVVNSKPDIKLFRQPENIEELRVLQKSILKNTSRYVKKGGNLIYVTCTVFEEENSGVVEDFLKENIDFSLQDFTVAHFPSKNGTLQLACHTHGVEGYFIAKLKKN